MRNDSSSYVWLGDVARPGWEAVIEQGTEPIHDSLEAMPPALWDALHDRGWAQSPARVASSRRVVRHVEARIKQIEEERAALVQRLDRGGAPGAARSLSEHTGGSGQGSAAARESASGDVLIVATDDRRDTLSP
jgi:hypothetical protein